MTGVQTCALPILEGTFLAGVEGVEGTSLAGVEAVEGPSLVGVEEEGEQVVGPLHLEEGGVAVYWVFLSSGG